VSDESPFKAGLVGGMPNAFPRSSSLGRYRESRSRSASGRPAERYSAVRWYGHPIVAGCLVDSNALVRAWVHPPGMGAVRARIPASSFLSSFPSNGQVSFARPGERSGGVPTTADQPCGRRLPFRRCRVTTVAGGTSRGDLRIEFSWVRGPGWPARGHSSFAHT